MNFITIDSFQFAIATFIDKNLMAHAKDNIDKGIFILLPVYIKRAIESKFQDEKVQSFLISSQILSSDGKIDINALEEYAMSFISQAKEISIEQNLIIKNISLTFDESDFKQFFEILRSV